MRRLVFLFGVVLLTSCAREISTDTSSDNEAMRTLVYEHEIGVPVSAAWAVFADFGGFAQWNGLPMTLEIAGQGLGMTRSMDIPGIGRVSERLDQRDDTNMKLAYALVEGNPLGMVEYRAEVTLSAAGKDRTLIKWRGEFQGNPGADLDQMAADLTASYKGMSEALGSFVAQRP